MNRTNASADGQNQRPDDAPLTHDERAEDAPTRLQISEHSTLALNLFDEMRLRWSLGERPTSEEYVSTLSDESRSDELVVDLIYCEYALRQQYRMPASPKSFFERFPKYADALRRQFELDEFLSPAGEQLSSPNVAKSPGTQSHPLLEDAEFPTQLGKYLLLAPLESGGQAHVYLGLHPTLLKEVVVKLSRNSVDQHSTHAQRLLDEGRILARLEHESLAQVYDLDQESGYPYVIMEYVRGQSLDRYRQSHNLKPHEACQLVARIARAVALAHREHVLHLDIKPRNILVDHVGNPHVIDFGLARWNDGWSRSEGDAQITGTLEFMAPEQAGDATGTIGPATDIFGLGGLLYYLLTGQSPFAGGEIRDLLTRIRKGDWNRASLENCEAPTRLKRLCAQAMSQNPSQRPESADEFAGQLENFSGRSRTRWKFAAGFIGLMVAACVASYLYQAPLPPDQPELVARVWDGDHYVNLHERLPLQSGDELQFTLSIPENSSAALLLQENAKTWRTLKIWQHALESRQEYFPDVGQAVRLDHSGGSQIVILLTSAESSPPVEQWEAAWPAMSVFETLSPYTLVFFDRSGIESKSFSKGFGPLVDRPDPEQALRDQLSKMTPVIADAHDQYAGLVFVQE